MRSTLILLVSAHLLIPTLAQADVIQPEFAVCSDLQEGDDCAVTEGTPTPLDGTCQMDEQCRLNYGGDCDGGGPCGTTCSDSLKCMASKTDDEDSGSCAVPSGSVPLSSGIFFLMGLLLIVRLRRS